MLDLIQQPIGILGGTFDPVHYGHLRIARELQQAWHLAEVRFIPCWQPVHRSPAIATTEQRLIMLARAIENESTFILDDCEIQRKTPSYMVETLEILRDRFPQSPLCLIIGMDAWAGFAEWHRYETILDFAHLLIAQRPSYSLPQTGILKALLQKHLKQDISALHQSLAGNIILHSTTAFDISASAIRHQIAEGKNPRYLLPNSVYDYIIQQGIYT